jgi:hypothetical protein
MQVTLDLSSMDDYARFLRIKSLPHYKITGRVAEFPNEYADRVGLAIGIETSPSSYQPLGGLFDYQLGVARLAIQRQKFAVFMECGLGKTLVLLEFANHAAGQLPSNKCVLIVSPLMVVDQTIAEAKRFYGDSLVVEYVPAAKLGAWLASGEGRVGITNYDSLRCSVEPGRLGALILDESSMLKSAYGRWGQECIRLGNGLDWKLALTGTPAPNDRIEYANHAVFLDAFPTVNSFLARFFINRGQTDNRWELKPHALRPFYRALSHWSIFLTDPGTYGWKDNAGGPPPIHVHIHDIDLTHEQSKIARSSSGQLFQTEIGGIGERTKLSQLAKGSHKGKSVLTNKSGFIKSLVESEPDSATIIWCLYDDEQSGIEALFPGCANIHGSTKIPRRKELVAEYQAGARKILVSKGKILGFGLNLQVTRRMVFSGLQDSYETYWQCVKRANRVGSDAALNVHIPATELEIPMIENVMRKARMIAADTAEQEAMFKDAID